MKTTTNEIESKLAGDGDKRRAAELALGRILRMGSRPAQPGDVEEYERCRAIIMATVEV